MTGLKVDRDYLNDVMEMDHVILVNADQTVSKAPGIYAPDVINLEHAPEGSRVDVEVQAREPWQVQTGRSGQYSYRGAVMHVSEYIGGSMADDILSTPGYWVAVEVRDDDGSFPESDPIGWALLYLPADDDKVS